MSRVPQFELDPALEAPDLVAHQTHQLAQILGNFAFYDHDFARGLVDRTQTRVMVTDDIAPDFELPADMSRRKRVALYGPNKIMTEHRFWAKRVGEGDYAFRLVARTVQQPVSLPTTIALQQQPMYDGLPLRKIIKNVGLLHLTHQLLFDYYTPNPHVVSACESYTYKDADNQIISESCTCSGMRLNLAEERRLEEIETAAGDDVMVEDAAREALDEGAEACFDPTSFDTVHLPADDPDALLREWASFDFDGQDQSLLNEERYQTVALAYGTFRQLLKQLRRRAGAK